MSAPISPSEVKAKIPGPNAAFCEKFVRSLSLGKDVYDVVNYFFKEDGTFSEEFIADWCTQATCDTSGTGTGSTLLKISATDGQYDDKVLITWNAVGGALNYDVYRANADNFNQAAIIADNVATLSYEDASVVEGTFYYYWVRARNGTTIVAGSTSDRGHAGSLATTLPPITDLLASKGFGVFDGAPIALVWTPVSGAESYDIYRNTQDDFGTSNLIDSNRTPYDNSVSFLSGPTPTFVDNGGELVYYHNPGAPTLNYHTKFYFWVVAKRTGPPATSQPSNSGMGTPGWAVGFGDNLIPLSGGSLTSGAAATTIPSGVTKAWFALYGAGGDGAGGDTQYGGGGGGGGAMAIGWITVAAGAKIRVKSTPEADGTNTPSATNGGFGSETVLQYSANGLFTDAVDVLFCDIAGAGLYNVGGAGAGGAGAPGGADLSVNEAQVFNGRAGKPGSGNKGGRGGHRFGAFRQPGAHFNGFNPLVSFAGDGGTTGVGSGSYASSTNAALAIGGKYTRGRAVFIFKA